MTEKVDVVVVGAGLAGLACGWALADAGLEVVVVERGDYPGSKNVSGGRLYLHPVRALFPPDFWDGAPFERQVVKERLSVMADGASATVELASDRFRASPAHSCTVLRATFDQWLAEKASAAGALVIPKYKVDSLTREGDRIVGVTAGDAELRCDVVVAADGALSFMAEQARLRGRRRPQHFALAVKEVIELAAATIEERFALAAGEGAAQLFFGSISQGMFGGGFLYTNASSLSVGMVVGIGALSGREPPLPATEVLEGLKARPEVAVLIAGGTTVEYSAHAIPEGGRAAMPRLYGDGILLVGDAAGLALNTGITVRGMDFALASGVLAARAIVEARARGDFSADSLRSYEEHLRRSFVLQDMATFAAAPRVLDNPRLFDDYPAVLTQALEHLFWIDAGPKRRLAATLLGDLRRGFGHLSGLRDALSLRRM